MMAALEHDGRLEALVERKGRNRMLAVCDFSGVNKIVYVHLGQKKDVKKEVVLTLVFNVSVRNKLGLIRHNIWTQMIRNLLIPSYMSLYRVY